MPKSQRVWEEIELKEDRRIFVIVFVKLRMTWHNILILQPWMSLKIAVHLKCNAFMKGAIFVFSISCFECLDASGSGLVRSGVWIMMMMMKACETRTSRCCFGKSKMVCRQDKLKLYQDAIWVIYSVVGVEGCRLGEMWVLTDKEFLGLSAKV